MPHRRRDILKLAALSGAAAALPPQLARALGAPPRRGSGTVADVAHVVIFMQENRAFDHYFGTLRGVRGFSDPRALRLPGGGSVFRQPAGDGRFVQPFHLDSAASSAQVMDSLDHSWKGSERRWRNWDAWVPAKTALTMGHFTRADLPFYYALADAFTLCDAYHCSIFGPTNPNRLFLMTGTSGLSVGRTDPVPVTANPPDETNETASAGNDSEAFAAFDWTTYPERLSKAGVTWKLYQEYDNYGDNALAYFAQYRRGGDPALIDRARRWVKGSDRHNAKQSHGEHLIAAFAEDVKNDALAQVSWIVAPYIACEHPKATPGYGQALTAGLLEALAANPEVFAKTAFILNYDENDGFFDHVPPLVPPLNASQGACTMAVDGEDFYGEPVGFGPRVPLIVVSPWSRGGFVNSQLHDHTSIIRFLETRFGVMEPNITPWRRALAGDLTSLFDFAQESEFPTLPSTAAYVAAADRQSALAPPAVPARFAVAAQEPGQRPARPLPYDFDVEIAPGAQGVTLRFANRGPAGAGFIVYAADDAAGPWHYAVEAGKQLVQTLPLRGRYDLAIHGANGFYRHAAGSGSERWGAELRFDRLADRAILMLHNGGGETVQLTVQDGYLHTRQPYRLAPGEAALHLVTLAASDHWYDLTVSGPGGFRRQLAGHIETGRASRSDPAIGRA